MRFSFVRASRFFLPLSGLLVLTSFVLFYVTPPQMSIEFTGGTLMEMGIPADKTQADLLAAVKSFKSDKGPLTEISIAKTKAGSYFVRAATLTNDEHTALIKYLDEKMGKLNELQYTTIGPTVGSSLKLHTLYAIIAAMTAIILYLAFAFRRLPRGVSTWSFGVTTIIGLAHDIILKLGIFTVLSHYTTFQFDTLFATALLSTMSFTVSDKVVIFDRMREMLANSDKHTSIGDIADKALYDCLSRTFNMGIAVLIMLFSFFIFGSDSIRWFMMALIVGTVIGIYSSYFVATPLLVFWRNSAKKR